MTVEVKPEIKPTGNPEEIKKVETPVVEPVEKVGAIEDESATRITTIEEASEVEDSPEDTDELPEVNSKTLNQVQKFLTEAGVDPKTLAKEFTKNNGELPIDVMKKLVDKHGESVTTLIVSQLKALHKNTLNEAQKRDSEIYTQIEESFKDVTDQKGSETWVELATWAKDNVSSDERAQLNKLIAQGGISAKLAIGHLINSFKSANDNTPAQLLEGGNTGKGNGVTPLSKSEYTKELNILLAKGHDYNTSKEIKSLQARRTKGLQAGM